MADCRVIEGCSGVRYLCFDLQYCRTAEGESDDSLQIGASCVRRTAPVFHYSSRADKIIAFNPEKCSASIGIGSQRRENDLLRKTRQPDAINGSIVQKAEGKNAGQL
jgi:hypothetical protein